MRLPALVAITMALCGTALADAPDHLGRDDVRAGVAAVRPRIDACARHAASADDLVKAAVRIAPSGQVTSVVIKETPSADLGTCVAEALQTASFRATPSGGAFSYPFRFRRATSTR